MRLKALAVLVLLEKISWIAGSERACLFSWYLLMQFIQNNRAKDVYKRQEEGNSSFPSRHCCRHLNNRLALMPFSRAVSYTHLDNVIVYKGNAIIVLSWRVKKRSYLNDKRAAVQALSGYSIPVVTVKVRVCCGAT